MTAAPLLADIRQNNGHPAAPSAALLTVREVAAWIGERRGRRPSRSTVYTALRDDVRGHRLASAIADGALHFAESDLAAFCETRDWPARSRPGAVAKFLKKRAASALRLGRNVATAALWSSGRMITHADFRRRSSQVFAALLVGTPKNSSPGSCPPVCTLSNLRGSRHPFPVRSRTDHEIHS